MQNDKAQGSYLSNTFTAHCCVSNIVHPLFHTSGLANKQHTISQWTILIKMQMHMQRTTCVKMRYFKVRHRKIARFLGVPSDARPQLHNATFTAPQSSLCLICMLDLVQACEAQTSHARKHHYISEQWKWKLISSTPAVNTHPH